MSKLLFNSPSTAEPLSEVETSCWSTILLGTSLHCSHTSLPDFVGGPEIQRAFEPNITKGHDGLPALSCILAEDTDFESVEFILISCPLLPLSISVPTPADLKIAKVVAHQLRTLHEDREVTRLGASVFESGLVSPEAMAATLRALKRFQRAVQSHGVDQIRVVATSAMRDARNARGFSGVGEGGDRLEHGDHLGPRRRPADSSRRESGEPGTGGRCCWSTSAAEAARLRSLSTSASRRRSACRWARCG